MKQAGERSSEVPAAFDPVRTDRMIAIITGVVAGLVYLLTMARTVSFWDSGEYIACAWIAGIPHPPCVPLFVLLGRFFAILLSFIPDIAVRINVMCVLAGGLSMGFLARLVQRWSIRASLPPSFYRPVSVVAGLLAGLSFTVWQNNNATETYALSQFIAILAIWVFDIWIVRSSESRPADRQIYLVLYLLTLAIAVHLAALIAVPGIAASYLLSAVRGRTKLWRNTRFLATALGLMVLAFSIHLYMPLRAVQRPEINETDPSEWSAFHSALARDQYGQISVFDRKGPVLEQIGQYFRYLAWQSGQVRSWERILGGAGQAVFFALRFLITLAAIWGAILLWNRNRRVLLLLGAVFLMASAFFIFYLNFKTGPVATSTGEVRERDYFYADSFALFAVFAAFGAGALLKNTFKSDRAVWGALILPLASLAGNYYECDRSGDMVARDYGINLLETCSEGAILITNGDNDTFPLWFAQSVLGVRRDVIVSNLSLMNTDWYVYQLLDRDPALIPFGDLGLVDSLRPVFIWGPHFFHVTSDGMPALSEPDSRMLRAVFPQAWPWALRSERFATAVPSESYGIQGSIGMQDLVLLSMIGNRNVHGRDVYLAGTVAVDSRVFVEPYLEMEGIAFRVIDEPAVDAVNVARSWQLMDSYLFTGIDDPGIFKDDQAAQLVRNYASAYNRLAYHHLATGSADSTTIALDRARSLFVAMPDEWMQILTTQTLLMARLVDGTAGSDSASSLILGNADELATYAASRNDSRLSQTAALLGQVSIDYQRESQLVSVVDSLVPGTAANAWLGIEVDLHFGNYIDAWRIFREAEAALPGDPMIPVLRAGLTDYLHSVGMMDRFDIATSALSSIVQFGDTSGAAGVVDSVVDLLARSSTASAAACCFYFAETLEDPGIAGLLRDYYDYIIADPGTATRNAEWFILESARSSPEVLAWQSARLGEPALCYSALIRSEGSGTAVSALLLDPAGYVSRVPSPGSGSGAWGWVNRMGD